jgi:hypothetical protein
MLDTGPKVAGSNLVKYGGFLRVIKICSTTSFGGEVKPSAHVRFYGMLKIHTNTKGDSSWAKFTAISRQVSSASLLSVSAGYCQRDLADES